MELTLYRNSSLSLYSFTAPGYTSGNETYYTVVETLSFGCLDKLGDLQCKILSQSPLDGPGLASPRRLPARVLLSAGQNYALPDKRIGGVTSAKFYFV